MTYRVAWIQLEAPVVYSASWIQFETPAQYKVSWVHFDAPSISSVSLVINGARHVLWGDATYLVPDLSVSSAFHAFRTKPISRFGRGSTARLPARYWATDYWSPSYWGEVYWADPTREGIVGDECPDGYWHGEYWSQAYHNEDYWSGTCVTSVEFRGLEKVGGDDVPYRSRRNKGWNKKAWKKKQKLLLDIEYTLRNPYHFDALGVEESFNVPPEIHVHVADEYEKLLARLREIDDEEAAMLLL